MKYYADATVTLEPDHVHEGLCRRLAGSDGAPRTGVPDDIARDALIYFGLLEQASTDACRVDSAHGEGSRRHGDQITAATGVAAAILADNITGSAACAALSAALDRAERMYRGRKADCVLPEGYAFYGLFPELYIELGAAIAAQVRGAPVVVIGIRSIGTSLSAALQAGLQGAGVAARRFTVRPTGDPFARVTTFTPNQVAVCRAAVLRSARFVIVDEGPGLSGSSIASVAWALEDLGVAAEHICIACANRPEHLPMAGTATLSLWQRVRWWAARDRDQAFWHTRLPALLSRHLHTSVRLVRDLSWGAWSEEKTLPELAAPLPHLERRKLLFELGSRRVLAKFVGFGEVGAHKAKLYAMLAAAGFVPEYRGHAHGLLLTDWVAGEDLLQASQSERQALLSTAARYYAHIFRHARAAHTRLNLADLAQTSAAIATSWLGTTDVRTLQASVAMADAAGVQALDGDQRPERVEWRITGGRILKCDAADHFLDHTWARHLDICFDLAGFALEWSLNPLERQHMLATYTELSGDRTVQRRLPFFAVLYIAHRLATFDTAFHAAQPADRQVIDQRRHAYGAALQQVLAGGAGNPCVS